MAISTPTVLTSDSSTATAAAITTSSISPSANALLVVIAGNTISGISPEPTIADALSGGSLTWTRHVSRQGTSGQVASSVIFTAITGSSPGSGTVTVTWNGSLGTTNRKVVHVVQVASGYNASSPVAQVKSGDTTATSLSFDFDSTPAATSLVLAGVTTRTDGDLNAAPGAQYTEMADTAAGSNFNVQVQYDITTPAATVDWSALGAVDNVGVAIEIVVSGGAATGQPTMRRWSGSIWPTGARRIGRGW